MPLLRSFRASPVATRDAYLPTLSRCYASALRRDNSRVLNPRAGPVVDPGDILVVRLWNAVRKRIAVGGDHRRTQFSRITPFMNFRMTIAEAESAPATMIGRWTILPKGSTSLVVQFD